MPVWGDGYWVDLGGLMILASMVYGATVNSGHTPGGLDLAENKTKQTSASVSAFIDAIPEETRRADAKTLIKVFQKVTGEKPKLWGPSIIGFGTYHYRYESGREGDTVLAGFSPRKPACVLYGLAGVDGAEALLKKLGKHTQGKGCVYIKKLADVDLGVLEQMIDQAVKARRAP